MVQVDRLNGFYQYTLLSLAIVFKTFSCTLKWELINILLLKIALDVHCILKNCLKSSIIEHS